MAVSNGRNLKKFEAHGVAKVSIEIKTSSDKSPLYMYIFRSINMVGLIGKPCMDAIL